MSKRILTHIELRDLIVSRILNPEKITGWNAPYDQTYIEFTWNFEWVHVESDLSVTIGMPVSANPKENIDCYFGRNFLSQVIEARLKS